jgi:methanogenic corrinoid protein MtbC1
LVTTSEEGTLQSQLLERQPWGEFRDIPCAGKVSLRPWSIPIDPDSNVPSDALPRFIEVDVVPGLVQAHRALTPDQAAKAAPAAEMVEAFATLILADEASAISAFVDRLHDGGASFETLYLGLLSATARRLGEFWEADIVDFTSVTIGLWRLQELLRAFAPAFQAEGAKPANGHRALLLSTTGEQHNFGLAMLGEFLFRDGWSIAGGPGLTPKEISHLVKSQSFAVAGISLSGERGLDALESMIALIRRDSCNRGIVIMVGGALFLRRPELVAAVGADSTAADARQGALQAGLLINTLGAPL